MDISKLIKQLRIEENITQKQMADMLNICQSCYARYENGTREIPLSVLVELTKIFNVSSDYLLGIENY